MSWGWRLVRRADERSDAVERALRLEVQLQELRVEAASRDRSLAQVRADLEHERARNRTDDVARGGVVRLVEALATPVVQVLTLAHLHGTGSGEPSTEDVLAAALRMVRALGRCGVHAMGALGERVVFDPTRHDPLSAASPLQAGDDAVVRVVGLTYEGRVVRKAAVEAVAS